MEYFTQTQKYNVTPNIPSFLQPFFSENPQNNFSEKLETVVVTIKLALEKYFGSVEEKVKITTYNLGIEVAYIVDGREHRVNFPINQSFQAPHIGGWYEPRFDDLNNTRPINLNIMSLMRFTSDDLAYILIHEAIHAGILNGTSENHDEASTDTFALNICEQAGIYLSFQSGYSEYRKNLAKFGDRVRLWQERVSAPESITSHDKEPYKAELAHAIISLVVGDEPLRSLNWGEIERYILQHRYLLQAIFPRLISLSNGKGMRESGDLHLENIQESLQKEMAQQFWEDENKVEKLKLDFNKFFANKALNFEDKLPNAEMCFKEFLQENEAMYLWDFADLALVTKHLDLDNFDSNIRRPDFRVPAHAFGGIVSTSFY